AIIMLTDENDCSIKEYGQFWIMANLSPGFHLPAARSECAANPNDPCCKSCGSPPGDCPPDPVCDPMTGTPLNNLTDTSHQRCWAQKRRFGIDSLYGTDRYVTGLTSSEVPDRDGNLVPNPIFSDLNPTDDNTNVRDTGLVFFAGILGVPWQDVARDPQDLTKG